MTGWFIENCAPEGAVRVLVADIVSRWGRDWMEVAGAGGRKGREGEVFLVVET